MKTNTLHATRYTLHATRYTLHALVKLKFSILLLMLLTTSFLFAQNPSGISINWDANVGCQVYSSEIKERQDPVFIEDIPTNVCITVCESSVVNYTLSGNFATTPSTTWTIIGGTINSQTSSTLNVTWGIAGAGAITFVTATPNGNITKTICFNKVLLPIASFNVVPTVANNVNIEGCTAQITYFTNLSATNGGSGLFSYSWDFGDGSLPSSAFEPSHTYNNAGTYLIRLVVTNSCGCSSSFTRKIHVQTNGFDISCPSVLCDGQSAQYSIPASAIGQCADFDWTVVGGTINSQGQGLLNVTWNDVDATGFGYVTFNPRFCNLECPSPTTIKVPVIKNIGTIIGNNVICLGSQARYVLPQWPTTSFNWQIVGSTVANPLATVINTDQRNEVIINPLVAGTITLKCTYNNTLLHCGGTATIVINVIQPLTIAGQNKLCKNSTGNYTVDAGQVANWTLSTSAGAVLTTVTNSNSFSYNFATSGNYQLSLGGNGTPLCPSSVMNIEVVTIQPPLAASISGNLTNICPTSPYTYTIAGANPGAEYVWSVPSGGTFDGPNTGSTVNIIFDAAATHQIVVFNRTLAPLVCSSTATTVTVNTQQINARITDGQAVTVCPNKYEDYQVISTLAGNPVYTAGDTYVWSIANPSLGSVTANQGTNNATILWNNVTAPTTTTLILTITKCTVTTTITKTVTIVPVPTITLAATSNSLPVTGICSGSPVTFTVAATSGFLLSPTSMVNWDFGNGNTLTAVGLSTTFNFSNLTTGNVSYTVRANIINPNNCVGTTNNASFLLQIFPGPTAAASIFSGGNGFCPGDPITTILAGTSSTAGATFQWFKVGSPSIVLGTSGTLAISSAATMGFGGYYFKASNAAGCSTLSNIIEVVLLDCDPPQFCTVVPTPNVTNTSSIGCIAPTTATNCNCGIINLTGVTTPTPTAVKWDIVGPGGFALANFVGTSIGTALLPLVPGDYNITKKAFFICTNGQLAKKTVFKKVTVPYTADFAYTVACNGSNSYNISFIDKSPFYSLVPAGSRTYKYYRATTATGPWTLLGSTQLYTQNGVTPGNYFYKIVVTGTLAGTAQTPCEKIIPINIAATPTFNIQTGLINCHDDAVGFSVLGLPGTYTTFWTFDAGATNTLLTPKRVFNTSGPQTVTVLIRDQYGCALPLLTKNIVIPAKCFNGAVNSSPNPPKVCTNSPITLQYVPTAGECTPTSFIWMNSANIVGTTAGTVPSFNVTAPGFYWVKVISALGCSFDTTQRITPIFRPLPTLSMSAIGTICSNATTVSIVTNVTNIAWVIDGIANAAFNNLTSISLTNLSVGNHTVTATATADIANGACVKTVNQTFTVAVPPTPPTITRTLVTCNPYVVKLTASNTATGTYNWSNGAQGNTINVLDGGPYGVSFYSNGCSSYAQTDVPKNPEIYLWSFPTGCYTGCDKNVDTILGPQLPSNFNWNWLQNTNTIAQGTGNVAPLVLTQSGTYNLGIGNGFCNTRSKDMSYTSIPCEACKIKLDVKDLKITDNVLCINQVTLSIDNQSGAAFYGTIANLANQVIIAPSGVLLQPGVNLLTFDFIPINGFAGGLITIVISGATKDGKPCLAKFDIELKGCRNARAGNKKGTATLFNVNDLNIAPNPAKNSTTISFNNTTTAPFIEVYNVLGKLVTSHQATSNNSAWQLDTSDFAAGLYLVVLKENNQIIMQKKLVIE